MGKYIRGWWKELTALGKARFRSLSNTHNFWVLYAGCNSFFWINESLPLELKTVQACLSHTDSLKDYLLEWASMRLVSARVQPPALKEARNGNIRIKWTRLNRKRTKNKAALQAALQEALQAALQAALQPTPSPPSHLAKIFPRNAVSKWLQKSSHENFLSSVVFLPFKIVFEWHVIQFV